jgi:hypothetical protein
MMTVIYMAGMTFLQNASFTLVSRARNSDSIAYHAGASVLSNGIWLLVIRNVVTHLDSTQMMVGYLIGAVAGSLAMHWVAMRFFEKKRPA